MITATYRAVSKRLREYAKASRVVRGSVIYLGEGFGGSYFNVVVGNGGQTTITVTAGEKLADKVALARKRLGEA